jgi:hypothetical protein
MWNNEVKEWGQVVGSYNGVPVRATGVRNGPAPPSPTGTPLPTAPPTDVSAINKLMGPPMGYAQQQQLSQKLDPLSYQMTQAQIPQATAPQFGRGRGAFSGMLSNINQLAQNAYARQGYKDQVNQNTFNAGLAQRGVTNLLDQQKVQNETTRNDALNRLTSYQAQDAKMDAQNKYVARNYYQNPFGELTPLRGGQAKVFGENNGY